MLLFILKELPAFVWADVGEITEDSDAKRRMCLSQTDVDIEALRKSSACRKVREKYDTTGENIFEVSRCSRSMWNNEASI